MLHRHPLARTISDALGRRCGVQRGDAVLVAVSGGVDSVALLRALAALADRRPWQLDLAVAHVNHHLRPDADEDAAFVQATAAQLGMPCFAGDVRPTDQPGNIEANARRMRYRALAAMARRWRRDTLIATAHHADDQLETMLMRLVRGTSARGLAGIADRTRLAGAVVVRPMLDVDRAAAVGFCEAAGQAWREDTTNRDVTRWRARLRADVLPVLRELRPDAAAKATDAARQLRRVDRLTRGWARRMMHKHASKERGMWHLDRPSARRMPAALLGWIIRAAAIDLGCPADRLGEATIDRITAAAHDPSGEHRRVELAAGVHVEIAPAMLVCSRQAPANRA